MVPTTETKQTELYKQTNDDDDDGAASLGDRRGVTKAEQSHAVWVAIVALCNFVPTAEIIDAFKLAVGCAPDASVDEVREVYRKAAMRSSANRCFEFRHEDKGGDQDKAAFCLRSVDLLFPTDHGHEMWRAAYDGLCGRLVRPRPDTCPPPKQLGSGADGEPFREDISVLVQQFIDANEGYSGSGSEVSPVTRRTEHSATATHSRTVVQAGAGKQHPKYPWRGDLVVVTTVSATTDCTINGTQCTMSRRGSTLLPYRTHRTTALDWDLQVDHTLSSFEAYDGSATLDLEHQDGTTYRMVFNAADSRLGVADAGFCVFDTGRHVRVCVGLGGPTSTGGRGDLYIVLHSDLEKEE